MVHVYTSRLPYINLFYNRYITGIYISFIKNQITIQFYSLSIAILQTASYSETINRNAYIVVNANFGKDS